MLEHASRPETLAMMRLVIATAARFPTIAAEASRPGWDAGRRRVMQALGEGSDCSADAEKLVEEFIDLVFAPHQFVALLGEDPPRLLAQAPPRASNGSGDYEGAPRR